MVRKSFSTVVDGGINAVAINKDANSVVVAGRHILKIYEIRDDLNTFIEKHNLRVGKSLNLNYSTNDVAWNHLEERILATAATNGAVVIWNLDRDSRNKYDQSFLDHRRTVNKVCFHPHEAHLLLSGSQDGTMKLFDLRKREAANTFMGLSESVRDIQFAPFKNGLFSAVQENGNVQLWDLRKIDQPERQFTAHSGPVFSCDWHPDDRKLLATGGRDKTIKVWDLSTKPTCVHNLNTISPVARIRWRPQRLHNIASSSLVVDYSIYVWDVDRPYVPFAAFIEHRDITTSFVWRGDPHTIISAGKDATLYQHSFKDACRPADRANNHGLDLNINNDVCFAFCDYPVKNGKENRTFNGINASTNPVTSVAPLAQFYTDKLFKKPSDLPEKFKYTSSLIRVFSNNSIERSLSTDWFVLFALRYRLVGRSFSELCEHNANVALELDRPQIAQSWRIIRQLYTLIKPQSTSVDERVHEGGEPRSRHVSKGTVVEARNEGRLPSITSLNSAWTGARFMADSNDPDPFESEKVDNSVTIGSFDNQTGFFFGEDEILWANNFSTDFEATGDNHLVDAVDDSKIFSEMYSRNCIDENYLLHDLDALSDHSKSPYNNFGYADDNSFGAKIGLIMHEEQEHLTKTFPSNLSALSWKFSDLIVDVLQYYANQGDVQTTVSFLIVLGDRVRNFLDESLQESWFHSYIDLLSRFQLWNIVNQIIRVSCISNINNINQTSTTVYTSCGKCQRASIGKVGWLCDRCKALPSQCGICHEVVKGLYVWCQGCSHGGHLQHISDWHAKEQYCPSGCGHLCEYV